MNRTVSLGGRDLHWLNPEQRSGGVAWGLPWPQGTPEPLVPLIVDGQPWPVQSRPTAYWPDGSVKWTAHATVFSDTPPGSVKVTVTPEGWSVDTGAAVWSVPSTGPRLLGPATAGGLRLSGLEGFCLREDRSETEEDGTGTVRIERHRAEVVRTEIETQGPLRVVFRQEGFHRSGAGRSWLPFVLRMTFWAGTSSLDLVHTLVFDGDPATDFVKGLALRADLALDGEPWNRHVAFAGDQGLVREAACGLMMRRDKLHPELYLRQHRGAVADVRGQNDPAYQALVDDLAVWDGYRLHQGSADGYSLRKRTQPQCSWVDAWQGHRARGLVYAGTAGSGGVALGHRNFWKKHPAALEVDGLARGPGRLTAWLWSPEAPAMDLRHYDTVAHEASSYEGFPEMGATPVGVANTSELTLGLYAQAPDDETLSRAADRLESPPLLVLSPEDYHQAGVFGVWNEVDRSTVERSAIEDQLEGLLAFYLKEVEQRRWYGFWNYGDVMHTYDPVRHHWRYDVGGYAWQNTELVPNLWLWISFLRTGREDVFRMAEAMSRHTSETDVYHLGAFQGLGSRHNVVHWGCGCKEARISVAGLHRPFYYLTGDERMGEILDEVRNADFATTVLDPMRAYFPPDGHPAHIRSGPDWAAFSSNWMTRWERHQDTAARDKLLRGLADLKAMPFRLTSGPTFGYDPATGGLSYLSDNNYSYHMVIAFGAPEVWMELADILGDEEWKDMLAEFGEAYVLTDAELRARTGGRLTKTDWEWPMFAARMIAYAGRRLGRPDLTQRAWRILTENNEFLKAGTGVVPIPVAGVDVPRPVDEIPWLSTNWVSQWSLNAIECLALDHD